MANLTLEQFKDLYLATLRDFNRGNLERAFAALAPDCEWRSELSELVGGGSAWSGREQITRFHEEWFELIPDWHVDSVQVLQAGDQTFVALDRGRGSGRDSGAPFQIEIASVIEIRDLLIVRIHQYRSWQEGLRAAGLDPSMAPAAQSATSGPPG